MHAGNLRGFSGNSTLLASLRAQSFEILLGFSTRQILSISWGTRGKQNRWQVFSMRLFGNPWLQPGSLHFVLTGPRRDLRRGMCSKYKRGTWNTAFNRAVLLAYMCIKMDASVLIQQQMA